MYPIMMEVLELERLELRSPKTRASRKSCQHNEDREYFVTPFLVFRTISKLDIRLDLSPPRQPKSP